MITVDQMLAFGLAALILIAIPGPSVVFVIGRALSYGRGIALASVAGNSLGLLVIVVLVALGLGVIAVSYTHLRAHETVLDLVCRLLLEKKKKKNNKTQKMIPYQEVRTNPNPYVEDLSVRYKVNSTHVNQQH